MPGDNAHTSCMKLLLGTLATRLLELVKPSSDLDGPAVPITRGTNEGAGAIAGGIPALQRSV